MNYTNRTWAEIELSAVEHNFREIKRLAGGKRIFAVVKANAYGHGAVPLARLYQELGVDGFAVSNIGEALELREGGITAEILILGYTPYEHAEELSKCNIIQSVYSHEYATKLNAFAEKHGCSIRCHIKLDTGMCRLGFECENGLSPEAEAQLADCRSLDRLKFEGAFTHFAVADSIAPEDIEFSNRQYESFKKGVEKLHRLGFDLKYIHCDNSAGTVSRKDGITDTVRPGIVLYGYMPSPDFCPEIELRPVLSLRTAVSMVKKIKAGDTVSYGRSFTAEHDMLLATVPIGYADGYPRSLSGKGEALIHGKRASVVGRICMDQLMLDVTGIENVRTGDTVTVIGNDGGDSITADDIAAADGTICYEILCGLAPRVERIYK